MTIPTNYTGTGFWRCFEVDCVDYNISYPEYLERHKEAGFTSQPLPEEPYKMLRELVLKVFEIRQGQPILMCTHDWIYDGSSGYGTNRYVCSKCGATKQQ